MTITIERATPADVPALVAAQVAAFDSDADTYPGIERGGPPGYDSQSVMLEKVAYHLSYKIMEDARCIGGIVISTMGRGRYHLDSIFLDPAYHNRGIGTQAMQFIQTTHPATRWTLDTPLYAVRNHHFYEKLGFVRVGEYIYAGFALISYEKHIADDAGTHNDASDG